MGVGLSSEVWLLALGVKSTFHSLHSVDGESSVDPGVYLYFGDPEWKKKRTGGGLSSLKPCMLKEGI